LTNATIFGATSIPSAGTVFIENKQTAEEALPVALKARAITLMGIAFLAGCTAAPKPASQPAAAPSPHTTNVARQLQNHWDQCLEQSYRRARTQTPDKNVAAEMAF
jgi:hypothetical protein